MAELSAPLWDIIGAYAVGLEEGLLAAAYDDDALKWVARVLKPPREMQRGVLRSACELGDGVIVFRLIDVLHMTRAEVLGVGNSTLLELCKERHEQLAISLIERMRPGREVLMAEKNLVLSRAFLFGLERLAFWLIDHLKMTREEVMASDNRVLFNACTQGNVLLVARLISEMKMTREEVMARNNRAFYGACIHGHQQLAVRLANMFKFTFAEARADEWFGVARVHGWNELVELARALANPALAKA